MRKKGELVIEEVLEIILAAAGVFLLVLLFYNLLSPGFDKTDETAKSYFNILEEQMALAKSGGEGKMFFVGDDKDKLKYFIVYFGDKSSYEYRFEYHGGGPVTRYLPFIKSGGAVNSICICSGDIGGLNKAPKFSCNYCEDLKSPADYNGGESFAIFVSDEPTIKFENDKYIFGV